MITNSSLWVYFSDAGTVVKMVMLLLAVASIASWAIIVQRGLLVRRARKAAKAFEDKFASTLDFNMLHADMTSPRNQDSSLAKIFKAGFKVFSDLRHRPSLATETILDTAQRAMRVVQSREGEKLEQHLSILATIGSTSPYVGLFGTVWGIMAAFHSLGGVQQATIAMVAPGISEALIATAMGLFAAIPAVIFYNRYAHEVDRLMTKYETFQEEFATFLYHEANKQAS